jgi:hypothetical protein
MRISKRQRRQPQHLTQSSWFCVNIVGERERERERQATLLRIEGSRNQWEKYSTIAPFV